MHDANVTTDLRTPSAGLPLAIPVTTMEVSLGKYSDPCPPSILNPHGCELSARSIVTTWLSISCRSVHSALTFVDTAGLHFVDSPKYVLYMYTKFCKLWECTAAQWCLYPTCPAPSQDNHFMWREKCIHTDTTPHPLTTLLTPSLSLPLSLLIIGTPVSLSPAHTALHSAPSFSEQ